MADRKRPTPAHRGPVVIDLDETPLPQAPSPADAPRIEDDGQAERGEAAARALHQAAAGGGSGLGRIAVIAFGGLGALALGVGITEFVARLLAQSSWLGGAALVLAGLAGLVVLVFLAGEVAGLLRLRRIDRLRQAAEAAASAQTEKPARRVIARLDSLYAGRPEMEAGRARAREAAQEVTDAQTALAAAERALMPALDAEAEAHVVRAARNVAAATALLPNPALDLIVVLASNLRMIRRIAALYGGRAGWLGSWRLTRAVAAHLVAAGAVSAADDLLGPALGHGVLARLSRRFGEAAVNATLTARVGAAAMEVCRPLPFLRQPRPRTSQLVLRALGDWRSGAARADPPSA